MRESSIEQSTVGHSSDIPNYQDMARKMTVKIRRNVLLGRFTPEPRDRSYRECAAKTGLVLIPMTNNTLPSVTVVTWILIHSENNGNPHCVALRADPDDSLWVICDEVVERTVI